MSSRREPQLALRLDAAAPDRDAGWHEGTGIAFLGGTVRLTLDTAGKDARLDGDCLHLPLPPQATPRQIRDRAEAWLREAATRRLGDIIAQKSALAGRRPPALKLSFAAHGNWAQVHDAGTLRCNWRLIEQPVAVIEQVLARAVAALPREEREADLFAALA